MLAPFLPYADALALSPRLEFGLIIAGILLFLYLITRFETRRYYFIRHGETLLNKQKIKQGAEGALSDRGKAQAEAVGAYLAPLGIQRIYTSPFERARETAEIIKKAVRASVRTVPLLAERRNPSAVIGKPTDDPEVRRIIELIDLRFHRDDYRFADEENFLDLVARGRRCLRYLERQSGQRFCVVTHHAFLKILLSCMSYPGEFHVSDHIKFAFFNQADNGGVTICEYRRWKRFSASRGWTILEYNKQLPS